MSGEGRTMRLQTEQNPNYAKLRICMRVTTWEDAACVHQNASRRLSPVMWTYGWFFLKIPPVFSGLSVHMPVVGGKVSYNTRQCDASLKGKRSDMDIWWQPLRWCKIHPWCQEMVLQNTSLSCPCLGGKQYLTPEAVHMREKKWSLDWFWFSCVFMLSFLPIQVSVHSFYVSLKLL